MENSLSKFELLWIYIRGHNLPKLLVFRDFKFETKSSVYFKIRGDLEQVPIKKVFPNCILYLQEFFQIFILFLDIFPEPKTGIRVC
jgi:hypothetical protein